MLRHDYNARSHPDPRRRLFTYSDDSTGPQGLLRSPPAVRAPHSVRGSGARVFLADRQRTNGRCARISTRRSASPWWSCDAVFSLFYGLRCDASPTLQFNRRTISYHSTELCCATQQTGLLDVRKGSITDMTQSNRDVRSTLESRHSSALSRRPFRANRWGNRPAFLWIAKDLGCCASG
jgi:hypothetical protein